ncbi:MAG TPA: MmcQ/YjbR family DNA-binding protein [Candidatus Saccharimonadales bacterium]|nr:MmcQ/YjbR family DNA-binding protein [Candidatus Saccharimonadales bacterium]
MKRPELENFLLKLPGSVKEFPFGKGVAVYKVNDKMFALLDEGGEPMRISLKCDPHLATVLRERYESVMPGYHLNKKHWNTVLLSGQLSDQEVYDLITHSYILVGGVVL